MTASSPLSRGSQIAGSVSRLKSANSDEGLARILSVAVVFLTAGTTSCPAAARRASKYRPRKPFAPVSRIRKTLDAQQNLADVLAGGHSLVCRLRFGKRENSVDDRFDPALLDQWPHFSRHRVADRALLLVGTRAQGRGRERQPLHQHAREIHIGTHAGLERDIDDASPDRRSAEVALDVVASDHVEDNVDAAA